VPGLAKTLTVNTLAGVIGGSFKRIQFTAGTWCRRISLETRLYNQKTGDFLDAARSPCFANPAARRRDQTAPPAQGANRPLLEVMAGTGR